MQRLRFSATAFGEWITRARRLNRRDWTPNAEAAREAVIYYTHFSSSAVRRELARLRDELGSRYDIFAAGYCRTSRALDGIDCVSALPYSASDLKSLPYPCKTARFDPESYLGNADLVPMRFFLDHPDYDHYWIIEYDVRFSGSWTKLFEDLSSSKADLLCTTLQAWADNPDWAHWGTLITGTEEVALQRRVKGFMPFCRLSRRFMQTSDARYRAGWAGHSEVIWPTVAALSDMLIEDIGGDGAFTPSERRGRYYFNTPNEWSQFPGTFVFRPSFADRNLFGPGCHFKGMLWHPVKE